jgi:hypothetical protein
MLSLFLCLLLLFGSTACKSGAAADPYSVIFNGTTLQIRAAFPGTEKLGEPDSMEASASCYYEGQDHLYVYGDLRITTYPKDGEFIASLELTGSKNSLASGVTVGTPLADVTKVYGEEKPDNFGRLVYEKDGIRLTFLFDANQQVERILVLLPTNP